MKYLNLRIYTVIIDTVLKQDNIIYKITVLQHSILLENDKLILCFVIFSCFLPFCNISFSKKVKIYNVLLHRHYVQVEVSHFQLNAR